MRYGATDPELTRFRKDLEPAYGDRLDRVVLFGCRARGDARPDSDYDVAIFLKEMSSFYAEGDRLPDLETAILMDSGAVINALPFPCDAYADRTYFMADVRREGIAL